MKRISTCILLSILLTSCFRLDDLLYNENKLSEYKLDHYEGEVDFRLDAAYHVPESLIHIFPLYSQAGGEHHATKIYAVYIGDIARIATDTVIMYCHGNRDHMDFYWPRAKLLAHTGSKNQYGVMMIDYRGYGMSDGKSSEKGLYADVDAALKWLKGNGLSNDRLVMYGFSMGTAPATKIAANEYSMRPRKLILEAPFASAEVMVQDGSGLALPGDFFTDLQINNGAEIQKVEQPFFWIHGVDDDFLSISTHGEVVYAKYKGSYKEAHRISGAGHSSIQTTMGFGNYLNAVDNFIKRE